MKKIAVLLAFVVLTFSVKAQFSTLLPLVAGDTIVNTGTVTKTVTVTTGPSGLFLQANLTKISGTGAGTAQLQLSLDNVNFVNSGSAYTITNTASQACQFSVASPVAQYVRILFTGSGTESVQVRIYYRAPKYQGLSTLQ
jgi:hypothetical protein